MRGENMSENATNFYASLPSKWMAAGALFLDQQDRFLIVKPTYRDGWLLPPGAIEKDESPGHACMREVKEEIDLDVAITRLLCVEYQGTNGPSTENIQFIFYGGKLTQEQIDAITLQESELSEYRLVTVEEALELLVPRLARRIPHCLQALKQQTIVYMESGEQLA
jgi:ADP-ribose pyrophosphatase YjhB (NUDIX family)